MFVTTDGVVVVDSKNPGWGDPLLAQIRELTGNPVTTLINTHSHHDHVSGNVAFAETVEIVTHENTKANMEVMRPYTGRTEPPANVFRDSNGHGLPTRTFTDRMTLGSGADRVELYYFGRGHTGGDAWVAFPALRTLHSGDVFLGQRVPFLDAENGGSGVGIPDTLQNAHDNIRGIDTIITGPQHADDVGRPERSGPPSTATSCRWSGTAGRTGGRSTRSPPPGRCRPPMRTTTRPTKRACSATSR